MMEYPIAEDISVESLAPPVEDNDEFVVTEFEESINDENPAGKSANGNGQTTRAGKSSTKQNQKAIKAIARGVIKCDCKWKSDECHKTQLALCEHEPNGLFTGVVEFEVPPKLVAKLAAKEKLTRPEMKKIFLLQRLSITCGIPLETLLSQKTTHLARHHWRRSALEFVDGKWHTQTTLHQFASREEWEEVTGVADEADIFEHDPLLMVVLAPNHRKEEWPALYSQYIKSDSKGGQVDCGAASELDNLSEDKQSKGAQSNTISKDEMALAQKKTEGSKPNLLTSKHVEQSKPKPKVASSTANKNQPTRTSKRRQSKVQRKATTYSRYRNLTQAIRNRRVNLDTMDFTGAAEEWGIKAIDELFPKNPVCGQCDPPPSYRTSGALIRDWRVLSKLEQNHIIDNPQMIKSPRAMPQTTGENMMEEVSTADISSRKRKYTSEADQASAINRETLLWSAQSLCNDFANKETIEGVLENFSWAREDEIFCFEHGWKHPSVPFLGRAFRGRQGAREYFALIASLLSYKNMKFTEYFVDVDNLAVSVRGEANFTWLSTDQSWDEVFTYRLRFDDDAKVMRYEVWADGLAAFLAGTGQLIVCAKDA